MELRQYQQECIDAIIDSWQEFDRVLVVLATGAGKTVIMSDLISKLVGKRILFLVHRDSLVEQFADKLLAVAGLGCNILREGKWQYGGCRVDAVLLDSAAGRIDVDDYDYIFIDEAHRAMGSTYRSILDDASCKVLGVTATPDRLDKKDLGERRLLRSN